MLVAADLQRPAAIEQLQVIGQQLGVPVYAEKGAQDPVKVCQDAVRKAREDGIKVVILDTAGRLDIDEELMEQLQRIDRRVQPDQVYLVVDGMTGQDAVNSAKAFNEALELDGVIMTKLDGDARGGAALSVKQVTGVPIKFIGTGEHLDALEQFRPDRMAGRILGMGDMVALVGEARKVVDQDEQARAGSQDAGRRVHAGRFQAAAAENGATRPRAEDDGHDAGHGRVPQDDGAGGHRGRIKQTVGIIDSMTPEERRNPEADRPEPPPPHRPRSGRRAARGQRAGQSVRDDAPLMKAMAGKGMGERMSAIRELQNSGLLDPGPRPQNKKGTGKRLTSKERAQLKKQRERNFAARSVRRKATP